MARLRIPELSVRNQHKEGSNDSQELSDPSFYGETYASLKYEERSVGMAKLTREQGIELLEASKEQLAKTEGKEQAFEVLLLAGQSVGYAPAFRCLVAGNSPESSIRWS